MTQEPAANDSGTAEPKSGGQSPESSVTPAVVFGYIAGGERAVKVSNEAEFAATLELIAASSVESALDVEHEPTSTIERWRYFRVRWSDGRRTRHLVGWAEYEGRACSAIVAIDLLKWQATTKSGRIYQLKGPAGHDKDASWVWGRWLTITPVKDPSDQTKALIRALEKAAARAKAGHTSLVIRSRQQ